MPSKEEINAQLQLLNIYRGNLARDLQQMALSGGKMSVQHITANNIIDARNNIQRIKNILRDWNIQVVDHPDDEDIIPQPVLKDRSDSIEPVDQQFQLKDLTDLADQYTHIRKIYRDTLEREIQMEAVYQKMETMVSSVSGLKIALLLTDKDPGKKLIAYAYLSKQPSLQFLSELIQSTTEEKQPFVQHRGIKAIKAIISTSGGQPPVESCAQLNHLLSMLKLGTQRHSELRRVIEQLC